MSSNLNYNVKNLIAQTLSRVSFLKQLEENITCLNYLSSQSDSLNDLSNFSPIVLQSPFTQSLIKRISISNVYKKHSHDENDLLAQIYSFSCQINKKRNEFKSSIDNSISQLVEFNKGLQEKMNKKHLKAKILILSIEEMINSRKSFISPHINLSDDKDILTLLDSIDPLIKPDSLDIYSDLKSQVIEDLDSSMSFMKTINQVSTTLRYKHLSFLNFESRKNIQDEKEKNLQKLNQYYSILCDMNNNLSFNFSEPTERMETIRKKILELKKQKGTERKKKKNKKENEFKSQLIEEKINRCKKIISKIHRIDPQISEQQLSLFKKYEKLLKSININNKKSNNRKHKPNLSECYKKIMCPLCHVRKRNAIISSCGHCFCLQCINDKNSCPICNKTYTDSEIKLLCLVDD